MRREEEFFYSDGEVLMPPRLLKDFPQSVDELETVPFQYRVNSSFDSFTDRGEILHRLEPRATDALRELFPGISFRRITQVLPLRLDQIRLGFEAYQTRFLGSTLGLIPDIKRRLFLEMTPQRLYLFMEEERATGSSRLPLEQVGILRALDGALDTLGLYQDFYFYLQDQMPS